MSRWLLLTGALLGIVATLSACGSDGGPDMMLLTAAEWKEDPGTVGEIGYWVSVDVGWPDRAQSCFDLPSNLRVTVNGREGTRTQDRDGDCLWDVVYDVGPFWPDEPQPTTVHVLDGEKLLGQATYLGLFPAYPARLASPADGKVRLGDSVVLNLLSPFPDESTASEWSEYSLAEYYWLDGPHGVPPYKDSLRIITVPDQQTIVVYSPARTGQAALAINGPITKAFTEAESCTGFTSCEAMPSTTAGPVFVEVVP
jgi:hypothetical protein